MSTILPRTELCLCSPSRPAEGLAPRREWELLHAADLSALRDRLLTLLQESSLSAGKLADDLDYFRLIENSGYREKHQGTYSWQSGLTAIVRLSPDRQYAGGRDVVRDFMLTESQHYAQGTVLVFLGNAGYSAVPVTSGIKWDLVAHLPGRV